MRAEHQVTTLPSSYSWWCCSWSRDGRQHCSLPPQCHDGQQILHTNKARMQDMKFIRFTIFYIFQVYLWPVIHLTVLLVHICSDEPWVKGFFGSLIIIHPHPGDPAGSDQSPTCDQVAPHMSPLRFHSHHLGLLCGLKDVLGICLRLQSSHSKDFKHTVEWVSSESSAPDFNWLTAGFPAILLALSGELGVLGHIRPVYCTRLPRRFGSPTGQSVPVAPLAWWTHVKTTSGRSELVAMLTGNMSCLSRSTWNCQSQAVARSPPGGSWTGVLPSALLWRRWLTASGQPGSCCSVSLCRCNLPRILKLGRQQYRPSPNAVGQQLKMCLKVSLLWSTCTQECLPGTGCADWPGLSLQSSACSHLVHAPCLAMQTILMQCSSSTSAQISSRTSWHFSFPCARS